MKITKDKIEKYRADLQLIRDVADQLAKDFGTRDIRIKFSGNETMAYQELYDQVRPVIVSWYGSDPGTLMDMLYRIDIDEGKAGRILSGKNSELIGNQLTELILEREFMKCLYRKLFKTN